MGGPSTPRAARGCAPLLRARGRGLGSEAGTSASVCQRRLPGANSGARWQARVCLGAAGHRAETPACPPQRTVTSERAHPAVVSRASCECGPGPGPCWGLPTGREVTAQGGQGRRPSVSLAPDQEQKVIVRPQGLGRGRTWPYHSVLFSLPEPSWAAAPRAGVSAQQETPLAVATGPLAPGHSPSQSCRGGTGAPSSCRGCCCSAGG